MSKIIKLSVKEKEDIVIGYRKDIKNILYYEKYYKISRRSIYRWNKLYTDSKESLLPKSTRPKSAHPNTHTILEINNIKKVIAKHKNIGINEIYGILKRDYGYNRHPNSLYRVLKKNDYFGIIKKKTKKHIPKIYNTPLMFGEKMQLDVKYVPAVCCTNKEKYYQYTILDEATRERFIYPYTKRNAYNSVDFLKRAIKYFKYVPKVIQTDNGSEFCNINENDIKEKNHIFDVFLKTNEIIHKRIKIKTPSHNGKVERSHGNDNKRFYKNEKFNSIEDLIIKMSIYLIRSNNIPNSSLGWLTPNEKRTILENKTKTC